MKYLLIFSLLFGQTFYSTQMNTNEEIETCELCIGIGCKPQ